MHSPNPIPRYLVPFTPRSHAHRFADVLIIGGGLAGLRAALAVRSDLRVLVITKDELRESNSVYAQGGIAGVLDPDDRPEWHIGDTLDAGGALCDPAVVAEVVREAPARIAELIEMGTRFDREADDGELKLGREGGHRHNRILHAAGDATGAEIMRAIIQRVRSASHIEVLENTFTLDLLSREGECEGVLVANSAGEHVSIWARQTILCTGGAGQLYRETTNPPVATADGHAMAIRAGVPLRDMEFVQFHPTVLYIAGSSRSLISEAVRGEGAWLRDVRGERFMPAYDPRAELAPRDVVSQAIVRQMEKTHSTNVFLDLSHLDPDHVRQRFPGIRKACLEFGLEITRDPIPVRPGAHYMLGGLIVDRHGRTGMKRLWAAGEATSSGLHGANRLASNSLLEGIVFGLRAGEGAAAAARLMPERFEVWPLGDAPRHPAPAGLDIDDIRNSLQSLMWRTAGVRRNGDALREASHTVDAWARYVLPVHFASPAGWELQNLLIAARAVIGSAWFREESRGVHWRSDFPEVDDLHWRCHVRVTGSRIEREAPTGQEINHSADR